MGTVDFFKILIDLGPLDKIDRPFEASAQKDQDFFCTRRKDFSQAGLPLQLVSIQSLFVDNIA